MHRTTSVFAALALCLGILPPAMAGTDDAVEIYGKFLDGWTEGGKQPINISTTAAALSAEDLAQLSDCAGKGGGIRWAPVASTDDLPAAVGQHPHVRLVDPDTWRPRDPHDLIAQGQSIESAVASGMAHGLLTLSSIAFDETHAVAGFTYAFVCGGLCGNGRPVVFEKTAAGWRESSNDCGGGWVSSIEGDRRGGSPWPGPLRGAAQWMASSGRE